MATELLEGWQCCELTHYSNDDFFQNPEDAIISWLDQGLALDDGLCQLDGMELRAGYMKEQILETEEQRDDAITGLDDPDWMIELPIGRKFCQPTKYRKYKVTIKQTIDSGAQGVRYGLDLRLEPIT